MLNGLVQNFWPRAVSVFTPAPKLPPPAPPLICLENMPPQGYISVYGMCNADHQPEIERHEDSIRSKIEAWVRSKTS